MKATIDTTKRDELKDNIMDAKADILREEKMASYHRGAMERHQDLLDVLNLKLSRWEADLALIEEQEMDIEDTITEVPRAEYDGGQDEGIESDLFAGIEFSSGENLDISKPQFDSRYMDTRFNRPIDDEVNMDDDSELLASDSHTPDGINENNL